VNEEKEEFKESEALEEREVEVEEGKEQEAV
jgi:hypothetical protein